MDQGIHRYLPKAEYVPPLGGYFFWLRLTGVNTAELRKQAQAYKVGFHPGRRFSGLNGLDEYVRLSYVSCTSADIEKGLMRLGNLAAEHGSGKRH